MDVRIRMTPMAIAAWESKKWSDYTFKVGQLEAGLRREGFSETNLASPEQVEAIIKEIDACNKELATLRNTRPDVCDPMPCQSVRHREGDNPAVQPMCQNVVWEGADGKFIIATHAKGGGKIEAGNFLVNTELEEMRFYCPASCKVEADEDARVNRVHLRWYTFENGRKVLAAISRVKKAKAEAERRQKEARNFEFGNVNVNSDGPGQGRPHKRAR